MPNFTKIPLLNPIKFVPSVTVPVYGMDNSWYFEQIKEWEVKRRYFQKWVPDLSTPVQLWSTIAPLPLKIYRCGNPVPVKTINWTVSATSGLGNIYEAIVILDVDDDSDPLPFGIYYAYIDVTFLGYSCKFVSEPIEYRASHPCTNTITYTNTVNDFDTFFTLLSTPFKMLVEADIIDFQPGREAQDYINQLHNVSILYGMPFREFKLGVGRAPGVANYVVDILNRILCLDTWRFNNMQFTANQGAKWEPTRLKTWPMAGWAIDVAPAVNQTSLEFTQDAPVAPGLVTAYDINNDLFGGTGTPVPITDYQQS